MERLLWRCGKMFPPTRDAPQAGAYPSETPAGLRNSRSFWGRTESAENSRRSLGHSSREWSNCYGGAEGVSADERCAASRGFTLRNTGSVDEFEVEDHRRGGPSVPIGRTGTKATERFQFTSGPHIWRHCGKRRESCQFRLKSWFLGSFRPDDEGHARDWVVEIVSSQHVPANMLQAGSEGGAGPACDPTSSHARRTCGSVGITQLSERRLRTAER